MPPVMIDTLEDLRAQFTDGRGYLAACTAGLATTGTRAALKAEWSRRPDIGEYCRAVEAARAHFARLVGVDPARIAIGAQTSVQVSMLAAGLPDGAEVLCPTDDFSSLVLPFVHAGRGIRVRTVPLRDLATAMSPETSLVAFSLVQSATGEVADVEAIVAAAAHHAVRTVCDATQAVGWMPVDATRFDALLCHTYKWLCPRGVAFLALGADYARSLRPVQAGWYAGDDPWMSCYGGDVDLATCARRFDVSPAWQAFVGAEPALAAFAAADMTEIHRVTTGLAAEFRQRIGLQDEARPSAIVTWSDPTGAHLARLTSAGLVASGRNNRVRVAFHVFNDRDDLARAVDALGF